MKKIKENNGIRYEAKIYCTLKKYHIDVINELKLHILVFHNVSCKNI